MSVVFCGHFFFFLPINANGGNPDSGTKAEPTTLRRCERVETKAMRTLMVFLVINDSLMFTPEPPFYLLVFQPSLLTRSSVEPPPSPPPPLPTSPPAFKDSCNMFVPSSGPRHLLVARYSKMR